MCVTPFGAAQVAAFPNALSLSCSCNLLPFGYFFSYVFVSSLMFVVPCTLCVFCFAWPCPSHTGGSAARGGEDQGHQTGGVQAAGDAVVRGGPNQGRRRGGSGLPRREALHRHLRLLPGMHGSGQGGEKTSGLHACTYTHVVDDHCSTRNSFVFWESHFPSRTGYK